MNNVSFHLNGPTSLSPHPERGAVLIVVLWMMLAMSLIALSFSVNIRTEVDAARNLVHMKQAHYMARAGVEYAAFSLLERRFAMAQAQQGQDLLDPTLPAVPAEGLLLQLPGGGARVEVVDEGGKINLNLAPDHLVYNLLLMIGVPAAEAEIITDSIEDWRDPDDVPLPSGAESDYYLSLPEPYRAKNAPLDVPEELLLVRGVTPEIYYGRKGLTPEGERVEYYGLQRYVTTFSNINRVNVNSASEPVLAAIPGLSYEVAAEIVRMRESGPIADVADITVRIPGIPTETLSYLSVAPSNVYTLVSRGFVQDSEVSSEVRAVIQVHGRGERGFSVLYWNESNVEL